MDSASMMVLDLWVLCVASGLLMTVQLRVYDWSPARVCKACNGDQGIEFHCEAFPYRRELGWQIQHEC